jgi:Mor family transcriptional regulator
MFKFKEGIKMEYKNGMELFPQSLLREIQKYVSGGLVYIPQIEAKHKEWGELSGIKAEICIRNYQIKQKFHKGITIFELAIEYCLAEETIKRIVYSKKIIKSCPE